MKKIVLLLMVVLTTYITNSQTKSGILKKDYYGSFSGDDWEDFLAGRRAADFEKKSNVKLDDYLKKQVTPFVTTKLNESSIASAVANSTVVAFPEDADVYTTTTDGTWITRKAYPGEKGFFHTASGLYWISFSCGNLTAFGPGPKKSAIQPASFTGAGSVTAPPNPVGNTNNITFTPGQGGQQMDYSHLMLGMSIRENHFITDAMLFQQIQDNKQCCGQSVQPAAPVAMAPSNMYLMTAAAPAAQQGGDVDVTVRNKANGWDIANTFLNGFNTYLNGVNTYRGVRLERPRSGYRYYNSWGNSGNGGVLFQGDNQFGNQSGGVASGGGYGNVWPSTAVATVNPTIRSGF